MKFGEHEYKVMGMAPYAGEKYAKRAEAALRQVFGLDEGRPARFRWLKPGERYTLLLKATLGLRFDAVAGGAQRLLEDTLLRWTRLMHQRYGGTRPGRGGGGPAVLGLDDRAVRRHAGDERGVIALVGLREHHEGPGGRDRERGPTA